MTRLREMRADDLPAVAAIYNEGIAGRMATFETEPRAPEHLGGWIEESATFPALVAERDGRAVGWARVGRYSDRGVYAGVGECTVYVAAEARGEGVGRRLIDGLAEEAERRGYWKLIGLLFPTNAASVALCRAAGCRVVGTHRRHGQLEGEWRDVVVVERLIGAAAG